MRTLGLIFGLLLLPVAVRAAEPGSTVRREAVKCAATWQRADYAGILAYLPPQVIRQRGGRGAVLREIRDQFAQARGFGVEQLEAIPGSPSTPRPIGRWLVTMVPLTAVLHGTHLELTQQTHVLGLSADQGRRWSFVLLYQVSQAELNAWFPEFAGKLIVPSDPPPVFEVVF